MGRESRLRAKPPEARLPTLEVFWWHSPGTGCPSYHDSHHDPPTRTLDGPHHSWPSSDWLETCELNESSFPSSDAGCEAADLLALRDLRDGQR